MATMQQEKRCYVITPYGQKDVGGRLVDFEQVYQSIVLGSVNLIERPKLLVQRSKDEAIAGVITESFIKGLFEADVAIIDISGNNPNVYYELGLRHVFRKRTNILIGLEGTALPFDIAGIRVVWYDHTREAALDRTRAEIARHIRQGLETEHVDSPVYKFLPDLRVTIPDRPCIGTTTIEYLIEGSDDRRLGIKTGAITDIKDVDVWVNSENTDMEMARPYDRAISSLIRYHGSKRDARGRVKDDLIQKYLWKQLGKDRSVAPATVIATEAGELRSRGVKALLHVASVQGTPGLGYRPIQEMHLCVTRCLEKLHELNAKKRRPDLLSILFPIFGTGQGGKEASIVLDELISAAYNFVKNHPQSAANRIYFLAYTEQQFELCRTVFGKFDGLVEQTAKAAGAPAPRKGKR